ncbi:MAG: cytochrome c peroxidase [Chloroflexota bacterium]
MNVMKDCQQLIRRSRYQRDNLSAPKVSIQNNEVNQTCPVTNRTYERYLNIARDWGILVGIISLILLLCPSTDSAHAQQTKTDSADIDNLLAEIIQNHNLQPNPGAALRETDSPLTQLGQSLFFDPILSGDQNIACATCHHPAFAMADGRVLPIGTGGHGLGPERAFRDTIWLAPEANRARRLAGRTGQINADTDQTEIENPFRWQFIPRNSPTIINSALLPVQFWDGRVEGYALSTVDFSAPQSVFTQERSVNDMDLTDPLMAQALFPIISTHEMAGATLGGMARQTIRNTLLKRLQQNPTYVDLFADTFDDDGGEPVTLRRAVLALAAFERHLIFTNAPWDQYLAGELDALTEQQKRGALIFFDPANPTGNCASCHSGDLFTDLGYHNLMIPQLGPGKGHGVSGRNDWGRAAVSDDVRDMYKFRTPSLRNVALTAPYFHDGAFATLETAIQHHLDMQTSLMDYDPTEHDIPSALFSSLQQPNLRAQRPTVARTLLRTEPLSEQGLTDLVSFLHSLTDPDATDLSALVPPSVPSGLSLDAHERSINVRKLTPTPPSSKQIQRQSQPDPSFRFENVATHVGLDFEHGAFRQEIEFKDPVAAMGGGLCWLDYDKDGWLDLYLVNSHAKREKAYWQRQGGLPHNALYRNQAGQFADVSQETETDLVMFGNGCVAADFNNDGWTDIYVTASGPNALLWNNGDGTFTEGALAAGVAAEEWNSAAVVGDVNGDGWLDLFVAAYIDLNHRIPKPSGAFPQDYYGLADRLYLNQGANTTNPLHTTFEEITVEAGLTRTERGLGAIFGDLDKDGDLDLYIANDGHPNRLYRNQLSNQPSNQSHNQPSDDGFIFEDMTGIADVGDSGSGMGVASGDYDGDGWLDLLITNWNHELNALYRNKVGDTDQAELTFQYSTFRLGFSGFGSGMTGWGTHLADFDQDSDLDMLIVNGRVPVTNLDTDPEAMRFYRNQSVNTSPNLPPHLRPLFREHTSEVGLDKVGPQLGRGSAVADFDNDGDLDVAVNTIGYPVVLLRNTVNDQPQPEQTANWLQVVLVGEAHQPGTRVTLTLVDGRQLVREVQTGSSYLASEDPRLHFGLGTVTEIEQLRVEWPNRQYAPQILNGVNVNQRLTISTNGQ